MTARGPGGGRSVSPPGQPPFILLVVAKAPVPGLVKTRLTPPASPRQAAGIASAALLDTLDAVRAVPHARPVIAVTGDLTAACDPTGLRRALAGWCVLPQRGADFAERLAHAHLDAAATAPGLPILQIGMDTPQLTPALLAATAALLDGHPALLAPAEDGGWWALGLRDPRHATVLRKVPMSRPDTGRRTRDALHSNGIHPADGPLLSDVDTMPDAVRVAAEVPGGRFAAAVRSVAEAGVGSPLGAPS